MLLFCVLFILEKKGSIFPMRIKIVPSEFSPEYCIINRNLEFKIITFNLDSN